MPDGFQKSPPRLPAITLAACFLFPLPARDLEDQPGWLHASRWLAVWGLVAGLLYAGLFGLSWRVFGEYQGLRWLPAAMVLALDLAWLGYRPLRGTLELIGRWTERTEPAAGPSALADLPVNLSLLLLVVLKHAMLISLPLGAWESFPPGGWSLDAVLGRLGLLYPRPVYRPLILMPLWGRWAMTLAMTLGRPAPGSPISFRRMCNGVSLGWVFGTWVVCGVLTVLYGTGAGQHTARSMLIMLGVLLVAYLAAFALARRENGQSPATIAAVALLSELAFLGFHIAVFNGIYWY